jgi:hypothetical protein
MGGKSQVQAMLQPASKKSEANFCTFESIRFAYFSDLHFSTHLSTLLHFSSLWWNAGPPPGRALALVTGVTRNTNGNLT